MALSVGLRECVLAAQEQHEGSLRVLGERFGVAVGTVSGWLRQAREAAVPHCAGAAGKPRLVAQVGRH